MANYFADIRRYDALADSNCVQRLAVLVADALTKGGLADVNISEAGGLERVRRQWCEVRLGFYDRTQSDFALKLVGDTMAGNRARSPVTYFYLLTKHLGRLDAIAAN